MTPRHDPDTPPPSAVAASPGGPVLHVARGAAGMFALKVAYSGLGFSLGIVLARALGAAGYGSYSYAMSWAVFLGVPAALGLDKFLVRQVAIDRDRAQWGHYRGLLAASHGAGLLASLALVAIAAAVAAFAASRGHAELALPVLVGLLMVPVLTLMKIRQAALTGLGQVVRGQWPEMLVHPLLLLTLMGAWWLTSGRRLSAPVAMGLTVVSSAVVLALGAWLLHRSTPDAARHGRGESVALPWRRSLMPLLVMGTIQMLQSQADILLLGLLASPRAVGIYGAATRGGQLVNFFLLAAAPALGPIVASLHAAGDMAGVERVAVRTARATFWLSLPVGLGLIVFGRWYLWLFGPQFVEGAGALAILCAGQLVNVACGATGVIMIMTGQEASAARYVAIGALANLAIGASLIPAWGIIGAAIGSTSSVILWNVLLVLDVRRRLGISCTCLGRLG